MNLLFEPFPITAFQLAFIAGFAGGIGWLIAVAFSLDKIQEFGLHRTTAATRAFESERAPR